MSEKKMKNITDWLFHHLVSSSAYGAEQWFAVTVLGTYWVA